MYIYIYMNCSYFKEENIKIIFVFILLGIVISLFTGRSEKVSQVGGVDGRPSIRERFQAARRMFGRKKTDGDPMPGTQASAREAVARAQTGQEVQLQRERPPLSLKKRVTGTLGSLGAVKGAKSFATTDNIYRTTALDQMDWRQNNVKKKITPTGDKVDVCIFCILGSIFITIGIYFHYKQYKKSKEGFSISDSTNNEDNQDNIESFSNTDSQTTTAAAGPTTTAAAGSTKTSAAEETGNFSTIGTMFIVSGVLLMGKGFKDGFKVEYYYTKRDGKITKCTGPYDDDADVPKEQCTATRGEWLKINAARSAAGTGFIVKKAGELGARGFSGALGAVRGTVSDVGKVAGVATLGAAGVGAAGVGAAGLAAAAVPAGIGYATLEGAKKLGFR